MLTLLLPLNVIILGKKETDTMNQLTAINKSPAYKKYWFDFANLGQFDYITLSAITLSGFC
jgi:hypothetical protein